MPSPFAFAHALERFLAAGERLDLEAIDFEQRPEIFPDTRLVIDHHDLFFDRLFRCHRFVFLGSGDFSLQLTRHKSGEEMKTSFRVPTRYQPTPSRDALESIVS